MVKNKKKAIIMCCCSLLALLSVVAVAISWYGLCDDLQTCDVAVVFGNKVERDGVPSTRLRARLEAAVAVFRQRHCPHLVVSGGIGKEGYDEALVMRDYLIAQGVPLSAVTMDNKGDNTRATALNFAAVAGQRGWRKVMVITQYFHIARAQLALRQCGFAEVATCHARHCEWRDAYSLVREMVGLFAYVLQYGLPNTHQKK